MPWQVTLHSHTHKPRAHQQLFTPTIPWGAVATGQELFHVRWWIGEDDEEEMTKEGTTSLEDFFFWLSKLGGGDSVQTKVTRGKLWQINVLCTDLVWTWFIFVVYIHCSSFLWLVSSVERLSEFKVKSPFGSFKSTPWQKLPSWSCEMTNFLGQRFTESPWGCFALSHLKSYQLLFYNI